MGQPEHMRKTGHNKKFQSSWGIGRPWLRYDAELGMWCETCHAHRNAAAVVGPDSRKNALVNPTKLYHYRNVAGHADTTYHLTAVGLSTRLTTSVSNMPIHLPAAVIPQVKILFRSVVYMTRGGIAHRRLKEVLRLQVANGVTYNLRYTSKSIPGILHFLGKAVAGFKRKLWLASTFRAIMTDEVKVGTSQWLATAVRLWTGRQFMEMPHVSGRLAGDGRDAVAIEQAIDNLFKDQGVTNWLDAALVAITVDGASVLLSTLCDKLRSKAPNAVPMYCASHKTQRVDHDVPEVPKA